MSRRLIFFLFTAVLALMAALLVHSALKGKEASIQALRQTTVYIAVAARPLAPGDTIDSAALRLVAWPRDQVPPGAFKEPVAAMGKVVKNSFGINQPIVASALLEPGRTGGVLPLLIPEGMRAMSIAVDEVSDMAGFVLPHSRVDVLVSVAPGNGPNGGAAAVSDLTKIVLQNIEVLAVAQVLEAGPDQPHTAKVVTLLVTPEQSERLAAAARLGTLQLSMRNFGDRREFATRGVSVAGLFGAQPAPAYEKAFSSDHHRFQATFAPDKAVEVIRNGTDHQTINFLANGRVRPSPETAPVTSSSPAGSGPPAPVP